jgi:4-hydroxy-tetrahydrodipicolinate reductase
MERLGIVVTGAAGRMGAALIAAVRDSPDLRLAAVTERLGNRLVGQTVESAPVYASLAEALDGARAVIDFTTAEASMAHAKVCAARGVALVLGTTGLSAEQKGEIAVLAKQTAIVMAPNMSVGVNVLFRIAAEVAQVLGEEYDVEIVETHHRLKKDAPSGTALRLAEVVADALQLDPAKDLVKSRDGNIGERPRRVIGVQTLRGGDVVGDHTVFYLGQGERIELTHKATSRGNFAQGALRAARWVVRQPPGLYDMQDVLGLRALGGSQ